MKPSVPVPDATRKEAEVSKRESHAESDGEPTQLRIVETIRVVESEALRERQLAAIAWVLRRAYEHGESGEDSPQRWRDDQPRPVSRCAF
jgi:hypothetical protein